MIKFLNSLYHAINPSHYTYKILKNEIKALMTPGFDQRTIINSA